MEALPKKWIISCAALAAVVLSAGLILSRSLKEVFAQQSLPPQISGVEIKNIQATSTVIDWTTDVNSDSVVNFSIGKNVGVMKDPNPVSTDHEMVLTDLEPATTYFFRLSSADTAG